MRFHRWLARWWVAVLIVTLALCGVIATAEEIPQMDDGSICYSLMFGPEVVGNGRIIGLAPGASEEAKARVLHIHQQNELRRLLIGGGPQSKAIQLDSRRGPITCLNCGGTNRGSKTYMGKWVGHCDICKAQECTATCWEFPGFPPCPPPC